MSRTVCLSCIPSNCWSLWRKYNPISPPKTTSQAANFMMLIIYVYTNHNILSFPLFLIESPNCLDIYSSYTIQTYWSAWFWIHSCSFWATKFTFRSHTLFFLTKNIARNRIYLNDYFDLRVLYIDFRRYLLRLNLNVITQNSANVGTQFTPIDTIFNKRVPKFAEELCRD